MNAPASNIVPIGRIAPLREPPASTATEQALLGALLVNPAAYGTVASFLKPDHFFEEIHRRIYQVFSDLVAEGRAATLITILPLLGDHELGDPTNRLTTKQYLARLCMEAATVINAPDYGRIIVETAGRRAILGAALDLQEAAYDMNSGRPDDIITRGDAALFDVRTEFSGAMAPRNRCALGAGAAELIEQARRVKSGEVVKQGVTTGFAEIDRMTGGYEPGMLWIVAARPGVGKTIYAVTSSAKVARHAGALVFSLEVPRAQIVARFLSDHSYTSRRPIEFGRILRSELDDEELWRLDDAQKTFAQRPLALDCSSSLTLADLSGRVRREVDGMARAGNSLKVAFIDYLKFIKATDRYRGNRVYEIGEISAGLKQLAKDTGICIVLLAQLNRALESRDDKRPGLADLRDSGDLEADADVVAFLHREAYHLEKSPKFRAGDPETIAAHVKVKHDCEVILGKNRAGPTGQIKLWCDVSCSTMSMRDRGEGGW